MQIRSKAGGQLKEIDFGNGGMPVVQEKPIKKKLNRLEMLRNLKNGGN